MRFLADENIPGDAVAEIEAAGHDIVWVRTVAPGSKDEDVLAWAVREERIILTFDKDFGELAWRAGLPASSGIVLIRLPMPRAAEAGSDRMRWFHARSGQWWGGACSVGVRTPAPCAALPAHVGFVSSNGPSAVSITRQAQHVTFR
jgi:hypothetical protein